MKHTLITMGAPRLDITSDGARYELAPGGSAVNVCRMAHALGMSSLTVGKIGNDTCGQLLSSFLTEQRIPVTFARSPSAATDIALCIQGTGQPDVYSISGTCGTTTTMKDVEALIEPHLGTLTYLYVSDVRSLPRLTPHLPSLFHTLRSRDILIVFDPGELPERPSSYESQILCKLIASTDILLTSDATLIALTETTTLSQAIGRIRTFSRCTVICRLPSFGATGLQHLTQVTVRPFTVRAIHRRAADVFNAAFLHAFDRRHPLKVSLRFAAAAAALACTQRSYPMVDEILHLYTKKYDKLTL